LKPSHLNRKINYLSNRIYNSIDTETRIDISSFSEQELTLLDKVLEIVDKYAHATPPKDVIEKNADLWYKGLEIFGKKATELFVEIVPESFCCDELESWYFKLYFYNFWLDWMESIKEVRKMPKEQHDTLLCERREMGMFDKVFRLKRYPPPLLQEQSKNRSLQS
jgi:hypothetical protein